MSSSNKLGLPALFGVKHSAAVGLIPVKFSSAQIFKK